MLPLKSDLKLHDVKKQGFSMGLWAISRVELAFWALLVLVTPALLLVLRPRTSTTVTNIETGPEDRGPKKSDLSLARLDLNRATAQELELLPGIITETSQLLHQPAG